MKRFFITVLLTVSCFLASGQTQRRVESIIRNSKALSGAMVGVMAVTDDGDTLASVNCDVMFQPASTMKLITTGSALVSLGEDYRFKTGIGVRGEVDGNGVLDGDLVIAGGADPTLCNADSCALSQIEVFSRWKNLIKDAGIKSIAGRIIGDGSFLGGSREHQDWLWEDIGTAYGTGMTGLSYAGNELRIKVSPGAAVGDSLLMRQMPPYTPWMHFRYKCLTGEKGTGDKLYLFTTDWSDTAEIRGTFALARNSKTVEFSNKFPEYTCASEFRDYLEKNGISSNGIYAECNPVHEVFCPCGSELNILGYVQSPALSDIVRKTNHDSDNFYAESIFRTAARESGLDGSYESGVIAEMKTLASIGAGSRGIHICDGSGLSRKNCVSPAFFCKYLCAMEDTPVFGTFLKSIPQAGVSGTVRSRLTRLLPEKRERVFMKSGSMSGVYCFCGYILPENPGGSAITFSVMINNYTSSPGSVAYAIDEIISALF